MMDSEPTYLTADDLPKVSVVIPAFNVAPYVGDAIRSALAQRGVSLEVIVVDDGSTDATRDVLQAFAGDPRVRLILQENQGPSGSRNTALAAARGAFVGFLDADDLWMPTKAARHVALMTADPSIDLSYSWWHTIDDASRPTGRSSTVAAARVLGGLTFSGLVIENFTGTASTVFCRRDAVVQVGGFDPALRSNVDLDLLLRLAARRPGNIALVPEILTAYRMRSDQITKNWLLMETNWRTVIEKAAQIAPAEVARVHRVALARQCRYLAYIAYEARDLYAARRLLAKAWLNRPSALVRDRRAWLTTAAVIASFLPAPLHEALAQRVVSLRARRAHA